MQKMAEETPPPSTPATEMPVEMPDNDAGSMAGSAAGDDYKKELYELLGMEPGVQVAEQEFVGQLSDVSRTVEAYGKAEQAQAQLQTIMVHDLMRIVAESHEHIQSQQKTLRKNESDIESLKQALLLVSSQNAQLQELASISSKVGGFDTDIEALKAQLLALQQTVDSGASVNNLKVQLEALLAQQQKDAADLAEMKEKMAAMDAAEEVMDQAFAPDDDGPTDDELYQQLLARTRALSGSEMGARMRAGFMGLSDPQTAFNQWRDHAEMWREERLQKEAKDKQEREAREELEARQSASDSEAERERLLREFEEEQVRFARARAASFSRIKLSSSNSHREMALIFIRFRCCATLSGVRHEVRLIRAQRSDLCTVH
jgi:hypothetical protein